jgi:hypothetical protein
MRDSIENRIQEFLSDPDPRLEWMKPAVRTHIFLPLYLGWVGAIGLRPDGSFVRWDHEDDREAVKPLSDPYWERVAVSHAAKKYSELAALLPERPSHAKDCDSCKGTGEIEGTAQIICVCGGLGWIIPEDQQGPPPG